jgi:NitT/TauT family transport system permease protein
MKGWQVRLAFFVSLLIVWQALYSLQLWPPYLFPAPLDVATAIRSGFASGRYQLAIAASLGRILVGYALSVGIGIPLGLLIGRVRFMQDTVGTLALALQTLPSICWLPLALLWFGLSGRAIIFVVVMGAVLSITLATADGVRNTPPLYVKAALTLGARGARLYAEVILPAALPSIVSGMKLGWSFAWRSLMAAELLYVSIGLGQLLAMGRELNDMGQVLAVMLLLVALGMAVDRGVFGPLERYLRQHWGLNE